MKVFMATPTRCLADAHPEFLRARDHLMKNGLALNVDHSIAFRHIEALSLLPMARNLLVALCLAEGADYVLMVDDDIFFRSEDVRAALLTKLPIVGLPCFLRQEVSETGEPTVHTFNYSVFEGEPQVDPAKDFRQVRAVGMGATLVHRDVFLAMQRHRPPFESEQWEAFYPDFPIRAHTFDYFAIGVREVNGKQVYMGEDYGFCYEAQKAGYPVFISCTSVTAHFHKVKGVSHAYLCDYLNIRGLKKSGAVEEAVSLSL